MLLDVCLGLRERYQDWLEMGRGLTRRGLPAPWLAAVDGEARLRGLVGELESQYPGAAATLAEDLLAL